MSISRFATQAVRDPVSGRPDGILKRPATDPKIIHTDTSNEYWQFRASLLGTDADGKTGHRRIRRMCAAICYPARSMAGIKPDARPLRHRQPAVRAARQRHTHRCRVARVDRRSGGLGQKGTAPPDSRVPRINDGTLVSSDRLAFPAIPASPTPALQWLGRTRFRPAHAQQRRRYRQVVSGYPEHASHPGAAGRSHRQRHRRHSPSIGGNADGNLDRVEHAAARIRRRRSVRSAGLDDSAAAHTTATGAKTANDPPAVKRSDEHDTAR